MKAWRSIAGVLVMATAAAGVVACSSSSDDNTITVYNAQHESLTKEWTEAFTKETGIKVETRNGEDTDLGNQLVAEGANSPADVFLTENSPAMGLVANAGLFADVDKATLDQVPAQYRPSDRKWTGIAARSTVFVYNKNKLTPDQLPKSLLDLGEPQWKGRWGAGPGGADFQAIVSALLELRGEEATGKWLTAMKQNAVVGRNNSAVMRSVNSGQFDGGVIYHYYWFGDQAKTRENSGNTELHYFGKNNPGDPGAFVSTSGGGVLKSSKKQAQAQQFLKFITGKSGQEVLQKGSSYEYPVGSQVAANPKLVPLAELRAPAIDPSKLDSKKVTELMTQAGLL